MTKRIKSGIFFVVILFGILTCVNPLYPNEQFLQHIGTVLLLIVPFIDLRTNRLSLTAYSFFMLFIMVHILGARYIYSYVPYNEWFGNIFHNESGEIRSLGRNHYDRFVHFAFGILFFPYLFESIDRNHLMSLGKRLFFVFAIIQTISVGYEIFEWSLSLFMSPEATENYNGQQGDWWDAQKDMALAMLGSTFAAIFFLFRFMKNKWSF
ncbi:MAG: DUF2238 domain-containing protein [Bacteroidales bacterium]|nr:DUF2238 domain-containing protein [Bacteroidales bacterium]